MRHLDMTAVVLDLPKIIFAAPKSSERVTFEANDFFAQESVQKADLYLSRMIFHNWGDKYYSQILQNLISALRKGSRIAINDHVIPSPGVLSPYKDWTTRVVDLVMKEYFNAKERDISVWIKLLKKADGRCEIRNVIRLEGS
ncbi:hypothetical protein DPSP01_007906 [Paraphaeosphaeria sporulosa]|uniref:S-adenosyl-L-methionine-dependent methyltransferase n=1 Tax=Paraphaeosphaeria sporulosa TaxID=1460663 RepID=A0A177CJX5_9PLEO|nr:S-adenosyl-L-methionine-dependent methyltransferase [Paraphaeosphaeria sporulosa]OAG07272.1 S-adenosyl-L-methionine-dependent methyltransferase [Paraphaeosphaeria sporulosa]